MKKFTKGALVVALVFVILGCTLCAVGAGIGFQYSSILEMIRSGEFSIGPEDFTDWDDWSSKATEQFEFSAEESGAIRNLNIDVECGSVTIKEDQNNQGITVDVKYRKENSKRNINVNTQNDTLRIEETDNIRLFRNNEVYIIVTIPSDMKFADIDLRNSAGEITIESEMKAENVSVIVDAGKCDVRNKLNVSEKLYAEVGAGEIDFDRLETGILELNAGVGEIDVAQAEAESVILDCGVGEISIALNGAEEDYSYSVDCGIGEVNVGKRNYSGLGTTKEIQSGSKNMNIDCGVGEVSVEFTR